jgi:hypothetical protein
MQSFHQVSSPKCYTPFTLSHACHMCRPSKHPWFKHSNDIWRESTHDAQYAVFLVLQFDRRILKHVVLLQTALTLRGETTAVIVTSCCGEGRVTCIITQSTCVTDKRIFNNRLIILLIDSDLMKYVIIHDNVCFNCSPLEICCCIFKASS